MAKREMIMTFNWDATVQIETTGFKGKSCVAKTKFMEDALKGKNLKRQYKPEYNQTEDQQGRKVAL